jgi:hypothetical protein
MFEVTKQRAFVDLMKILRRFRTALEGLPAGMRASSAEH